MKHSFSSFSISIAFQPKFLKRYLATNNAISNPQQKSEDMQNPVGVNLACEEVCMLENARQQVHTRAGFPGWKQKTCFIFVGHLICYLLTGRRPCPRSFFFNNYTIQKNFLTSIFWAPRPQACGKQTRHLRNLRNSSHDGSRNVSYKGSYNSSYNGSCNEKKVRKCSYNALLKFVQYCTFFWAIVRTAWPLYELFCHRGIFGCFLNFVLAMYEHVV